MQNLVVNKKDHRVSASIVSYFYNHGHDRGIEKFLKLRSRSNSDSSVSQINYTKHPSIEKLTKSLDNVSVSTINNSHKSNLYDSKIILLKEDHQDECVKSNELLEDIDKTSENLDIKVSVKQNSEKNKSPYDINFESVIEINMPTSCCVQQKTKAESKQNSKSIISSETQTSNTMKLTKETPKSTSKLKNTMLAVSPSDNSVASISNKQMEWDALADIGYEKYSLCEMKAHKQGKSFDEKIIVLRNKNIDLQLECKKMEEEEHKLRLCAIKKNKEKWQNVYDHYKEKYQHSKLDFSDMNPSTSTPKLVLQKYYEKSSQTSLIKNSSRSTQVNNELYNLNQFSSNFKTSDSELFNYNESVFTETPHQSETAASFEFIAITNEKENSKDIMSKHSLTASSSSFVSTNNSINMSYDEELQLAITLLKSLLDSKNMNSELKKNIATKIIQKIIRTKTSRSIQTSTVDKSDDKYLDSYPFSSALEGKTANSKISNKSVKQNNPFRSYDVEKILLPQTPSEIEHQKRSLKIQGNSNSSPKESMSRLSRSDSRGNKNENFIAYVKKEKLSQLNWIENEIEHLNILRKLLANNENSSSNSNEKLEITDENILYGNVDQEKNNELIEAVISNQNCEIPARIHKLTVKKKQSKKINDFKDWESHVDMKMYGKNRSKLETPPGDSDQCTKSFSKYNFSQLQKLSEKYENKKPSYDDDINLYSKAKLFKEYKKRPKSNDADLNTSTSLASSEVFISSESLSHQIENSKSETHPRCELNKGYRVFGTQTSFNSILKTDHMIITSDDKQENSRVNSIDKLLNKKKTFQQRHSITYTLKFDKKDCFNVNRTNLNSLYQTLQSEASSCAKNFENDDCIELKICLKEKKPKLFKKFEERTKCIEELKKLRYY